jgi:hypothetical protein
LIDQINSKLLFIRKLFDINDADLFHNFLLVECNRESISHWGNNSELLLENEHDVQKISKSFSAEFNRAKATIYMVTFAPEIESREEFEAYLSKTIKSMEYNTFEQKAEVLNSTIDSWSFNSEISQKVVLVLVDLNCGKPITINLLKS